MNRASILPPLLAAALAAGLGCTEEDLCHGPSCRVCPPEGCPSSAGVIHRSVGPGNTAPLASGEGNPLLRIEGSVATFRDPLPDRVGVGDALAATFGDTTLLAFVTLRRSAVAYELQTADGGALMDHAGSTTTWRLYRAYTSLSDAATHAPNAGIPAALADFDAAIRTRGNDLVALGRIWSIACYADAPDSADDRSAYFERWNTSADFYLRIHAPSAATEVGVSQRHQGRRDPTRYTLHKSSNQGNGYVGMLRLALQYARVEGLQLVDEASDSEDVLLAIEPTGAGAIQVGGNLFFGDPANARPTSAIVPYGGRVASTIIAHDNVIAGMSGGGFAVNAYGDNPYDGGMMARLYGNTIQGCRTAVETGHSRVVAVNNALHATEHCVNTDAEPLDPTSDHNLCALAENMTGPSSRAGVTPTWVDAAGGDLHLSPLDTVAAGHGADLSQVASFLERDVDGQLRRGAWDVGADQR